jgi:hypothetical protein
MDRPTGIDCWISGTGSQLDGNGDVLNRFVYGRRPNVPEYMVRRG